MNFLNSLVTKQIPDYLAGLPVPDSFGGIFKLGIKDWFSLIPPTALFGGVVYMSYLAFCPHAKPKSKCVVNQKIKKNEAKVVDMLDIEDISEKAAFCRCWKSKNFPYCDGAHTEHNKVTGDNVGPVVLSRKQK